MSYKQRRRDSDSDSSDSESSCESETHLDLNSDNESIVGNNDDLTSEIDSIIDKDEKARQAFLEKEERENQELIAMSKASRLLKKQQQTKVKTRAAKKSVKDESASFNKKKSLDKNLNVLFKKFNIGFNDATRKHELSDPKLLKSVLKKMAAPFVMSKASIPGDYKNIKLILTDNPESEFNINKFLISELYNKKKNTILINVSPYTLFYKIFFEINSGIINFTFLQHVLALAFISKKIILANRFKSTNYIYTQLLSILNLSDKVSYVKDNHEDFNNLDETYSTDIKNSLKNFQINEKVLTSFLKKDELPSNYREEVILEVFKIINFKSQIQNEAFDGFTKLMLSEIKNRKLTDFRFSTFADKFLDEYPMIPEKEIIKHYLYIVKNFDKQSQIPLFDFNEPLNKNKTVVLNKVCFDKILALTVVIEKKYSTFWSCLIPVQLFYGKDFYALNMKKIFKRITSVYKENQTHSLMSDGQNSLYFNVEKEGITEGAKITHSLELSGIDKNILKQHDPTKTKEEFILSLLNSDIKFDITNQSIVLNNPDNAKKHLKFTTDKNNLVFDFSSISYVGKTIEKNKTQYETLLKYYNTFLRFNVKLFQLYLLITVYHKTNNENIQKKIKELLTQEKSKDAGINQYNYPSSIDLDFTSINSFNGFANNFDYKNLDIDKLNTNSISYVKNYINSLYESYF